MAKILYVEDDDSVAASVQDFLQLEGHLVELATNGEDGIQLCANFEYDLLLLDWDLPGIPGIEVCKRYRQDGGNAWVIFLTGKSGIDNKENGLDAGADDYLTKPFEIRELCARIRRALRRTESTFQSQLNIDDLVLNTADRTISVNEATVRLMPKEAALLEYLMRNPNKLSNTNKLLSAVWPSDSGVSNGTVRTFMLSLRGKLEQLGKKDFIKTVPGSGYIIVNRS
jgi:DNA-binding response OmpR family regulator